ncbi:hypothetical protein ACIRPR_29915 [Streptomyces griseoflavus]|uniref:hypothetical protein n=1 Tax=Streptomyces griseoflavus TaxID=35619 RepID=UPI00167ED55E|nr:hypothetical protein [Streptomyces griseoflavus]
MITVRSYGLPLYSGLSVMRFLGLCRTSRIPEPADFEHDFGALITRPIRLNDCPSRQRLHISSC